MTVEFSSYPIHSQMWFVNKPEFVFVRGEGMYLYDNQGKKYLDFLQGWAVNCLGHCPRAIAEAASRQARTLINPSPAFYNEESIKLSDKLCRNSCFEKVFFANSGAEANEGAIKLARKWGKKNKSGAYEIITMQNSFHGRTLATMSASGKAGWDTLFAPQVPGFPKAEMNNLESVERLINSNTVAVMLEPVQGEGGVIPAEPEFLRGLRQLTKDKNMLLIVDEVQSGMGRSGKLFAYQHFGIEPDIMTLGKGIGGGVPLAALLAKEAVCCFEAGEQGGTYNGNPFTTAIGNAVLDEVLKPGFLEAVTEKGQFFSTLLNDFSKSFGLGGERGLGLLRALILSDKNEGPKIVEKARDLAPLGLLINSPRPNLLRFMPALTVSKAELELLGGLLAEVLELA